MIRGIDGRSIFRSVVEYDDFLARFAYLVRELGHVVLAWCLLGNHGHFVLKSGEVPLAKLMHRLSGRHAQRHNWFTHRVGHLFQGRYKAVLIESDAQLVATIPYVLGNSARHGLVTPTGARDYAWSMYGALAGRRSPREFENVSVVADALGMEFRDLHAAVESAALEPAVHGARLEPDQIDELDRLIRACCARHGFGPRVLRNRHPEARAAGIEICKRAMAGLDLPLATIARHVGLSYDTAWRLSRAPH